MTLGDDLTDRQRRFVGEYLIDLNATQAAIRAGYAAASADVEGCRLLGNAKVAAEIAQAQAERAARVGATADAVLARWWAIAMADAVLARWWAIAMADPNDLVEHRCECCRHCWGEGHAYQFTPAEHARAVRAWAKGRREGPDPTGAHGGTGFDPARDPHPDCPECHGECVGRVHAHDTRKLQGPAALLYRGTKRTRDGFEILMEDRAAALVNVAKHLGMFVKRRAVGSPGEPASADEGGVIDLSRLDPAGRAALTALGVVIYEGVPR